MAKKNLNKEDIELVYNSVEDYILENHKLCSLKDVVNSTSLSESKCRKILNHLRINNKIDVVYEGRGETNIYIPKYMFNEILRLQQKPDWLQKYSFKTKDEKLKEIEDIREEVNKFEIIERLLYGTDEPLEESVAYCLDLVGFQDVEHHKNNDIEDISFSFGGKKYLVEVKGKTTQANKRDITQLDSWVTRALNLDYKAEELEGVIVINNYRREDPANRPEPLTNKAKEFLKHYKYKFFTTKFLFDIVKKILNELIKKEEAKVKIIKGEKIE